MSIHSQRDEVSFPTPFDLSAQSSLLGVTVLPVRELQRSHDFSGAN
jgi:hypothetical protein